MNTTATNSTLFSNSLSPKNFNNWFSGNTTNFGSKSRTSLHFSDKKLEPKLFNGWFSGNTTNFCLKK
jgi:hypothetical protein